MLSHLRMSALMQRHLFSSLTKIENKPIKQLINNRKFAVCSYCNGNICLLCELSGYEMIKNDKNDKKCLPSAREQDLVARHYFHRNKDYHSRSDLSPSNKSLPKSHTIPYNPIQSHTIPYNPNRRSGGTGVTTPDTTPD